MTSLLFSNVRVHSYSVVEDSVLLPKVDVGRRCRIKKAVIDRGARIPEVTVIGENHDDDWQRGFRVSDQGVVLVTPDMLRQKLNHFR